MMRAVRLLATVFVLAHVTSPAASSASFEESLANLKSPNAKTRERAAESLGESRRREAVAPLGTLVRDPEPRVRMAMVKALRQLRDFEAVPVLTTSLSDGDPAIRREALGGIVEIYTDQERAGGVSGLLSIFSDEDKSPPSPPLVPVEPRVFEGLAARLGDAEPRIRRMAAQAIGILDGRDVARELTRCVADPDETVRVACATSIGQVGSVEEGKALIPLLQDESSEVVDRAITALGILRVREAGAALRQLYDTSRSQRQALSALETLVVVEDPDQGAFLRQLSQDRDPRRRRLAVEGLARIGSAEQIAAFKKDFQRERDEELRLAYAFALTLLGDHAFVDSLVLALPGSPLGNRSEAYLLELGTEILPALYPYLSDPDAQIRARLANIMATVGEPSAIPHLEPLIGDPNSEVADAANRAIQQLRTRSSDS